MCFVFQVYLTSALSYGVIVLLLLGVMVDNQVGMSLTIQSSIDT